MTEPTASQAAANTNPAATADANAVSPLQDEYPETTSVPPDRPSIISQDIHSPSQNMMASQSRRLVAAMVVTCLHITAAQASARRYPLEFMTGFAGAVLDAETGDLLEYCHLLKHPKYKEAWKYSLGNKVGHLAQEIPGRNIGTDTLNFIERVSVPSHKWKDMTNCRIVCNERPQKLEVNISRITADGSRLTSAGNVGTPIADLLTVKLLLNSVVSTPGAKFLGLDLKDFYLNMPMEDPEFMTMKLSNLPEGVIQHYNLRSIVDKSGYVFLKISKGMCGLPCAGLIT